MRNTDPSGINRIRLYREGDSWMAQHLGPHAPEVRRLFGSDTLPTAYGSRVPARDVVAHIEALNPGVGVYAVEWSGRFYPPAGEVR